MLRKGVQRIVARADFTPDVINVKGLCAKARLGCSHEVCRLLRGDGDRP